MLLQMAKFHSFLWLSSIPLYIYNTSSLWIQQLMDTGCFHILVIINSDAMNTGVRVSFQVSVFIFSDMCPRVGLLSRMVVLFLVFWETSILFSTVAAPICIPTSSVWVYECRSVGVYECRSVGVYECMSVGVYECMSVGVYECMSVWV